ncbi:hypothetical protein [Dactylosporangium sp. NPDC000521]|uniref:hypothetical protein n=1 Tax=Dactylosporangium sp. NPDC000521 TaxID=3363975 RepID=UPI0036ACF4B5
MKRALQITLAIMVGYILGRRRKLRMAMLLGAAAAAGRVSGNPADLLAQGRKLAGGSPTIGHLSGLARPLVDAGRAAARTAVSQRIESVSDRLRDRSEALRSVGSVGRRGARRDEDRGRDEDYDADYEDEEFEEAEEPEEPEEAPPPRPAARRRSRPRQERDEATGDEDTDEEPEPESEPEPPVRRRRVTARR